MFIAFQCRKKIYREYSDKMSLIRKYKCVQAVRIDLYVSSKPLPFKARVLTTQIVYSSLFSFSLWEPLKSLLHLSLRGRLKEIKPETLNSFMKHHFPFLTLKEDCFHVNFWFPNGSCWRPVVEETCWEWIEVSTSHLIPLLWNLTAQGPCLKESSRNLVK